MEQKITSEDLLKSEKTLNSNLRVRWAESEKTWKVKKESNALPPLPLGFKDQYGIALLVYTGNGIYTEFNAAVREGGQSQEYYMKHFHFKTLHFYLTRALQLLTKTCTTDPQQVYRGVSGVHFVPQSGSGNRIRFGQFTSSSLIKKIGENFGKDSFFTIKTCFGVPICDLSCYNYEAEVLIPGTEVFTVSSFTEKGNTFVLNSTRRTCSTYNCAYLGGRNARAELEKCVFNSAPRPDLTFPVRMTSLLFSGFVMVINAGVLKISLTF